MRVHKISNVNKALDFIASKGVKLVSIGAEGERGHASLLGFSKVRHLYSEGRSRLPMAACCERSSAAVCCRL